jgi:hypothetical protein
MQGRQGLQVSIIRSEQVSLILMLSAHPKEFSKFVRISCQCSLPRYFVFFFDFKQNALGAGQRE